MTILVGRSIIRRLGGLERTALQLAEVQLPDVVGRLRRGENVDVNAEAPALRVGGDEIGRVGQAFDLVRQTAIRAAVDEARLRQGLNDVFRSLARRSQSLLHRQLTLLDQMERRASDPEALDDLFRLDHLTTRMRRHAEGLVILAGAPPGRGWSSPVRMVDVMRGAIAEVEDYARVSVATRSQAALAGSAVADVIHLLAELIENATTLSPPYTSVRVSGDTVANGFAIEVEDRGLGMSPSRLAELNDRLINPPEFNPSDSEQLGLFVVSQLAKRHGIRVTLKASPYGGTTAIVLIARHLVVTEEAFRAGLPGEPASVTVAQLTTNGNHPAAAELPGPGSAPSSGFTELDGMPGLAQTPGVRISGPLRRSQGIIPERPERGAHAAHARPERRTARPAASRTTCPGGSTPSRGHRPTSARCRTASRRPRSASRRPHSMCSRRSGTRRDRTRRPDAGPERTPVRPPGGGHAVSGWRSSFAPPSYRRATGAYRPGPAGTWYRARVRRRDLTVHWDRVGSLPRQRLAVPGHRPGVLSGPAGPVPRLDPAQHARRVRRADRARPGHPGRADHPDDPGGLVTTGANLPAALGTLPRDRAVSRGAGRIGGRIPGPGPGRTGRRRRHQGTATPGQAGQPGSPASRQPAAAPDHGGQRRAIRRVRGFYRVRGSGGRHGPEPGRDPQDHVSVAARLAGGPLAADSGPGTG